MEYPILRTTQLEQALFEMRKVVVGQDRVLERLMVALLANGHCLLEGVPGATCSSSSKRPAA